MKKLLPFVVLLSGCAVTDKNDTINKEVHKLTRNCRVVEFSQGYENPVCAIVCAQTSSGNGAWASAIPTPCTWKKGKVKALVHEYETEYGTEKEVEP